LIREERKGIALRAEALPIDFGCIDADRQDSDMPGVEITEAFLKTP
jgi:hypothetical protein